MATQAQLQQHAEMLAQLRQEFAPKAGDPNAVEATCQLCGEPFLRWKRKPRPHCPTCSKRRQLDATVSMSNRKGGAYERSAVAQYEHWRGECIRLGLIPAGDGE